jgi:hypothetical protein
MKPIAPRVSLRISVERNGKTGLLGQRRDWNQSCRIIVSICARTDHGVSDPDGAFSLTITGVEQSKPAN